MLNKRASIPVTVFTVLALAVFVFALVSFAVSARALVLKTHAPALFVAKSAAEHRALVFAGEKGEFVREQKESTGVLWWKSEYVKSRVKFSP